MPSQIGRGSTLFFYLEVHQAWLSSLEYRERERERGREGETLDDLAGKLEELLKPHQFNSYLKLTKPERDVAFNLPVLDSRVLWDCPLLLPEAAIHQE